MFASSYSTLLIKHSLSNLLLKIALDPTRKSIYSVFLSCVFVFDLEESNKVDKNKRDNFFKKMIYSVV